MFWTENLSLSHDCCISVSILLAHFVTVNFSPNQFNLRINKQFICDAKSVFSDVNKMMRVI